MPTHPKEQAEGALNVHPVKSPPMSSVSSTFPAVFGWVSPPGNNAPVGVSACGGSPHRGAPDGTGGANLSATVSNDKHILPNVAESPPQNATELGRLSPCLLRKRVIHDRQMAVRRVEGRGFLAGSEGRARRNQCVPRRHHHVALDGECETRSEGGDVASGKWILLIFGTRVRIPGKMAGAGTYNWRNARIIRKRRTYKGRVWGGGPLGRRVPRNLCTAAH